MEFSSSPSSGSSKRAKTPSNHIAVSVSCLVDGCVSDLSQCREYHRRHKVCELHSKTPKVTIGGREQRFCQQCSRFHSLMEFDEGKRSCRKRLDGHNRRRRKPAPSDSTSRAAGMFLSNQHGSTILSFSRPQMHPSAVVGSDWAGKHQNAAISFESHPPPFDRHNLYSESSSASSSAAQSGNKGRANQFHLFQCGPTLAAAAASSGHHQGGNSNRALSLLSSPEPTPEIVQQIPDGLGQYAFGQEMGNQGDNNNDCTTTLQFQGMFQEEHGGGGGGGGGGSPGGARQQTLSFRWD